MVSELDHHACSETRLKSNAAKTLHLKTSELPTTTPIQVWFMANILWSLPKNSENLVVHSGPAKRSYFQI